MQKESPVTRRLKSREPADYCQEQTPQVASDAKAEILGDAGQGEGTEH